MAQRLEIFLDGPSDHLGDDNKGVSVEFFVDYVQKLKQAYQRTAQSIVAGQVQESGRLSNRAKEVDIRIVKADAGSLRSSFIAVDNAVSPELIIGLTGETLSSLCKNLEEARDGKSVPSYIGSLITSVPEDVTQQFRYVRNGKLMYEITMNSGMVDTPDDIADLAGVCRLACIVSGVTWEPGPTVSLRDHDNKKHHIPSTEALVEKALTLRGEESIVATIVTNKSGKRLIALRTTQERAALPRTPSTEDTMERFANVHAELAK